jgi:4-diphosphocytidyl-2-C-methyl-D-erythritol kinase
MRRSGNGSVVIFSPAKVNLFLEILARRDDGFHELETVMTGVGLYDHLVFAPRGDSRIELTAFSPGRKVDPRIPTDQSNLVWKALELVRRRAGEPFGATVSILKRIPIQAGLGGGSSNAAATLLAANRIWKLAWPMERLAELAIELGSDVPFFMEPGVAFCTGRGEKVQRLGCPCRLNVVLAKPKAGLSTKDVYSCSTVPSRPISTDKLLSALRDGKLATIGQNLWNRLEQAAGMLTDQIARLRHEYDRTDCVGHRMSGSGTSYFGIYRNQKSALAAANCLSNRLPDVRILTAQTLNSTIPFRWG